MSGIGIWVPPSVANNPDIEALDKLVLSEIIMLSNNDGFCFANNPHFAKKHGCSEKTIQRSIRRLTKQGFLRLEFDRGYSNRRIYPLITPDRSVLPSDRNDLPPQTIVSEDSDSSVYQKEKPNSKLENTYDAMSHKHFHPPSIEEVRDYCQKRENKVNADYFVNYYAARGWKLGNSLMMDWKSAVRMWEQKDKEQASAKPKSRIINGVRVYDV